MNGREAKKVSTHHEIPGEELALRAAGIGLDKKAEEPVVYDARGLTAYADYFVLLTGQSERQVVAIAEAIRDELKAEGHSPIGLEGANRGRWILLDYGDVVVHVLHQEQRLYYDLDGLWADARRVDVPGAPPARAF